MMNGMQICIVEILEVKENSYLLVREVEPNPSDVQVTATLASPVPINHRAGGLISMPEVQAGIKAIAVRYEAQFIITGFFPDFTPQLALRRVNDNSEKLEKGDYNLRSGSGNRVSVLANGRLDLFSNIWARLHLSQLKESLEAYFRRVKIKWFGGDIISEDDTHTRITLTQGFEKGSISDQDLATEEMPAISPTSVNLDDQKYVNKAIISNTDVPLRVETRQNTNGDAVIFPYQKDAFTVERRGHQGDEANTIYSFETIDRSRGTISSQQITESGLSLLLTRSNTIPGSVGSQGAEDWSTLLHLGEHLQIRHSAEGSQCSFEFLNGDSEHQLRVRCNDYTITMGDSLSISRVDDNPFELSFNELGELLLTNNEMELNTSASKKTIQIIPAAGVDIQLGNGVSFGTTTQGADNVLTPNTILNGVTRDTFTGIPFKGSDLVAVKKEKS